MNPVAAVLAGTMYLFPASICAFLMHQFFIE
jgi:hypothetical protein